LKTGKQKDVVFQTYKVVRCRPVCGSVKEHTSFMVVFWFFIDAGKSCRHGSTSEENQRDEGGD